MASFLIFGLVALVWLGLVAFFRYYRIWLFYYIVASVGLTFLIIFGGSKVTPLQTWLEMAAAYHTHYLSRLFGVPTRIFEAAPGNILVAVVVQEPGWTALQVGIECSALLESAVIVGLLVFYPGWSWTKRGGLIFWGLATTYVANIIRLLFIVLTLHVLGKQSIFIAHTIVGRLIFFVLVAGAYWLILTRPTVRTLSQRLQKVI